MSEQCLLILNKKNPKGNGLETVSIQGLESAFLVAKRQKNRCRLFVEQKTNDWFEVDLTLDKPIKAGAGQFDKWFSHDEVDQIVGSLRLSRSAYMFKPKSTQFGE